MRPVDRARIAIEFGHADVLEEYIKRGGDVNARDSESVTLLMHAANLGHKACVDLLLQHKASVLLTEDREKGHFTALHYACKDDDHDPSVILSLLRAGADVNHITLGMCSALSMAVVFGRTEKARVLLYWGVKLSTLTVRPYIEHCPAYHILMEAWKTCRRNICVAYAVLTLRQFPRDLVRLICKATWDMRFDLVQPKQKVTNSWDYYIDRKRRKK